MGCQHCLLMSDYYSARNAQEERAEEYSNGYPTEKEEFYAYQESRLTFKEFLIGRKGNRHG